MDPKSGTRPFSNETHTGTLSEGVRLESVKWVSMLLGLEGWRTPTTLLMYLPYPLTYTFTKHLLFHDVNIYQRKNWFNSILNICYLYALRFYKLKYSNLLTLVDTLVIGFIRCFINVGRSFKRTRVNIGWKVRASVGDKTKDSGIESKHTRSWTVSVLAGHTR